MRAVTSYLRYHDRILILKRSASMPTMPGRWAAVSGMIEGDEDPLERALAEIYQETGMDGPRLVARAPAVPVPIDERRTILIHPFLFDVLDGTVRLNRENVSYRWVRPAEISHHRTVPYLGGILFCLLGIVGALLGQHHVHAGAAAHGAGDAVSRVLAGAGVYQGGLLGVYG